MITTSVISWWQGLLDLFIAVANCGLSHSVPVLDKCSAVLQPKIIPTDIGQSMTVAASWPTLNHRNNRHQLMARAAFLLIFMVIIAD
jgi:hypothetical protein